MSHGIVLPVLLPLAAATALVLLDRRDITSQRILSLTSTVACCAVGLALAIEAVGRAPSSYSLGGWPAPVGILLVNDRLSSSMLVLTDVVALAALVHAMQGDDRAGRHFHALFQFQLVGVHGAFLTGDLFNLFVFFEILLIASYCLLLHGGGAERLRAAVPYVVLNLIGSSLFLVAIGTIYGVTGALNMAHIAVRIATLGPEDAALIRAAGLLALVVFSLKAAAVPFHFWLPRAYPAATAPVAALFAIMSKVGVYCIVRMSTLMFGVHVGVGTELLAEWLVPLGIATQLLAVLGALSSRDLRRLSSYLLIHSVGVMLAGFGLFSQAAFTSSLYYLVHSTVTTAALFLLADQVGRARGETSDRLERGPPIATGLLGGGFVIATLGMTGLPPFSGFLGKAGILMATPLVTRGIVLWCVVLAGGFVALLACARAGSQLFWETDDALTPAARASLASSLPWLALLGAMALLSVLGGPAMELAAGTATQLLAPETYVQSVLGAE